MYQDMSLFTQAVIASLLSIEAFKTIFVIAGWALLCHAFFFKPVPSSFIHHKYRIAMTLLFVFITFNVIGCLVLPSFGDIFLIQQLTDDTVNRLQLSAVAALSLGALYYSNFHAQIHAKTKLVITPHYFNNKAAAIHLRKPSDTFDANTYKELLPLIRELSVHGYQRITMSSPMFAKHGKMRSIRLLKRELANTAKTVTTKKANPYMSPLAYLTLTFLKYVSKTPSLQTVDINHWYTISIQIK